MKNKKYNRDAVVKTATCSCGGLAKMTSRRNYPFGRKAKPITTKFYKCTSCNKRILINEQKGGRK